MTTTPITEADVVAEAHRLMARAGQESLSVRLLGGAAVLLQSPGIDAPPLQRAVKDIDLVTASADRWKVADLIAGCGYEPDKEFNAFQGRRRLLFFDKARDRQLDVFVGEFSMCHVIPLADRLSLESTTIPLAELVLTKLQIVKLNEKDQTDLYRLFLARDVGSGDGPLINAARIAAVCSSDWGLEKTVTINLDRLRDGLATIGLPDADRELIRDRLERLAAAIASHPKSRGWRLRGMVGERVQWYEDPDEP